MIKYIMCFNKFYLHNKTCVLIFFYVILDLVNSLSISLLYTYNLIYLMSSQLNILLIW